MSSTNTNLPWAFVVNPQGEHTQTVFLLHGEGSSAKGFANFLLGSTAPNLQGRLPNTKWVFLRAPGSDWWYEMPKLSCCDNARGLQGAIARCALPLQTIIRQEAAVIGTRNIFLCGMDQGASVALHALIGQPERLAGFIGFCGWTPDTALIHRDPYGVGPVRPQLTTPVLVARNINSLNTYGVKLPSYLKKTGIQMQLQLYPGRSGPDCWYHVADFIEACVSSSSRAELVNPRPLRATASTLSTEYQDPNEYLPEPLKSQMRACLSQEAELDILLDWSAFMRSNSRAAEIRMRQQELQRSLVWCWREAAGWP